jgi:membrane protein CcdC involved in cytochrome C biogenesis
MKMLKKIIEFPVLVVFGAMMLLGPAFWYVIGALVGVFGLGILVGFLI